VDGVSRTVSTLVLGFTDIVMGDVKFAVLSPEMRLGAVTVCFSVCFRRGCHCVTSCVG
jgi:hypothetical protein